MSDPFIGQIMQVGFAYAPVNWLTCQGQTLQVGQNQALFALIGNRFGGNGTSNFALPDAQGRALIGVGQGPGLTPRLLGSNGGMEQQTIGISNMPSHTHGASVSGGGMNVSASLSAISGVAAADEVAAPTPGAFLGSALEQDTSPVLYVPANTPGTHVPIGGLQLSQSYTPPNVTVQPTGGANGGGTAPLSIMQPFLAVTTIIASVGIWPDRPN